MLLIQKIIILYFFCMWVSTEYVILPDTTSWCALVLCFWYWASASLHIIKVKTCIKLHLLLGRKVMTNLESILKSCNVTLPTKFHLVKAMVFPVVMYGLWELDYKESWALKNWFFWTVVLEKTLESPLDCKEIQPVHPKGDQSWVFIGWTDAEPETPILWSPHAKNWLVGKDPDAGRHWGQEEKGTTEDEMAGWHHELNGHGFGWTPGVGDGQEGLAWCCSWGCKALAQLSDWTELNIWEGLAFLGLSRGWYVAFAVSSLALFSALNKGFPDSSVGKEFTCNAEDPGSIPRSGRSAGEGKATHSSSVAWRIPLDSVVHGVAKSQTPLSDLLLINSFPSELLLCSFLHLIFKNLFILLHLFLLVCFSVLHSGHFLLISLSCHQLSLHLCLLPCYPSKKFLVSMAL